MVCTGIVHDGQIVLEGSTRLPEGLRVRIIADEPNAGNLGDSVLSLQEWLEQVDRLRAALPETRDSTDLLRQIREDRSDT